MTDLFNANTRAPDPIDNEDELHQAILAGTHSFKAGALVTVTSPDGERGTVPAENVAEAVRQGFRVETPSQRAVREYVEQNKGIKGAVKVGLGQLADEAAMGLPELILDKTQDPLEVAKRQALKKEHELANTLGGLTGFGASLFVGGPLFRGAAKVGEKTTAHVAEKLATTAAGEAGSRTLKTAAADVLKHMAAKGSGATVEGAIVTAPHAITELALGDPEAAAETLLAGAGIGTIFGAGGALAKDLFKLGKDTVVKGASLVTQQEENAKSLARKVAKVVTGVNEDDVLHYVQNAERVNAAPARENIMDAIDNARSKYATEVELARENLAVTRRDLDDAYRASRFDLAKERPSDSIADELMGALEAEKGVLGTLSEQADDALERSGLTFRRDDLLRFMDDVGGELGVRSSATGERILVSDEAVGAAQKLMAQRDRLASFGDTITAPELRGILRDVRRDINFNLKAGEFNDTLNKARKKFTERISDVLKGNAPGLEDVPELREYAAYMARMRDLSETLEAMTKRFGEKQTAVNSLNAILGPAGSVKEELLERFSALTGQDFIGKLDNAKKARELLELSKRQDMRAELLPELTEKVKGLEEKLRLAEEAFEPVRRLTPERTQSIIRNQAFKNASIKDRRALELLGEREGQNFLEQIRDRNVLDAFGKESTNGSRKTLLGAILGGVVGGGPIGGAVGGAIGATADVYGGVLLKKLIDSSSDVAGLLFSEKAMKHTADKLDKVPELLNRMSTGARARGGRPASSYSVYRLMTGKEPEAGEAEKEASRPVRLRRLEEFNEATSALVANPGLTSERIAALAGPVSTRGAPLIGEALNRKMTAGLDYLMRAMPRPPRPTSPFAPRVKWKPTDFELSAFEQKAQVIHDPFSVLDELERGTLTRNHMDALKAVYPGLYGMIRGKVQEAVVSGVQPLDYGQRVKLSLLMDAPMDTSLEARSIAYYQQVFQNADQTQEPTGGGQKLKVDVAGQLMTESDRLATRRA